MTFKFVLFICFLFTETWAQECSCGVSNSATRIVGGTAATPHEYPWMATILIERDRKDVFLCGGSIINDRYILTAAHCFEGTVTAVRVVVGHNEIVENVASGINVTKVIVHDHYTGIGSINDIALVELPKPLMFSKTVRPICLPQKGQRAAGSFKVAGWGKTGDADFSNKLLTANAIEKPYKECQAVYPDTKLNPDYHICAGSESSTVCQGDSGGPLMSVSKGRYITNGMVSFGRISLGKCLLGKTYSVFVRLEPHLDWVVYTAAKGKYCRN